MDCLQLRAGRQTGRSALLGPNGVWLVLAIMLTGCGTPTKVPPSNVRTNATLSPSTGVTRDLMRLPEPKARIPVAVYAFRDQTGQFKSAPDSLNSTLVTQGAASILVKALQDSGWYIPVEREGLQKPSVSHVLRLACLAPELVERCLAGQQPRTLTQRWLKRNALPDDWREQRDLIDRFE